MVKIQTGGKAREFPQRQNTGVILHKRRVF
jgi:hypothetical protein